MASRKLKYYFQAQHIKVLLAQPLEALFRNSEATRRIKKWATEMNEFVVDFKHRTTIKLQALADFIADWTQQLLTPHYNSKNQLGQCIVTVAPGFKNKIRYTPYVSPGSQISHIATNKGNIKRQCSIYNVLSITNITLDSKRRKDNSNFRMKTPIS